MGGFLRSLSFLLVVAAQDLLIIELWLKEFGSESKIALQLMLANAVISLLACYS